MKKIFAIGMDLPDIDGLEALSINTERSFLDADIICIEPTLSNFYGDEHYNGRMLVSSGTSAVLRDLLQHWHSRIATALSAGKLVIVFLLKREEKYYYSGTSDVSGTGRNRKTVQHVQSISNFNLVPLKFSKIEYAQGNSVILDSGAEALSHYWKEFGEYSLYNCIFELSHGRPVVLTKSGRKTVGALCSSGAGNILVLPELNWGHIDPYEIDNNGNEVEDADGGEKWSADMLAFARKFRDAIFSVDSFISAGHERSPPPDWANDKFFRIETENAFENEIIEINDRIEELVVLRDARRVALQAEGSLRGLLYEKGLVLEEAVRDALSILGFATENFKQGGSEFDALFISEEGRFLGEVEGKDSKPLNVDKVSQLQRNLLEDFSRDEVSEMAHGVLFGNADRLRFPSERNEFFTEKVKQIAKQNKISLVRTTDLFEVAQYLKLKSDKKFARNCRRAIIKGAGGIIAFPEVPIKNQSIVSDSPEQVESSAAYKE